VLINGLGKIMKIKTFIKKALNRIKKLRNKEKFEHKILARVSCLGKDILKIKFDDYKNIPTSNIQKGRLDLVLEWINGATTPKSNLIKKHLKRKDIFHLIKQQEKIAWKKYKKIEFLVLDSFSELTDQKFTHRKESWSFLAHYSDIEHSKEFTENFQCNGLLSINDIEKAYTNFFAWFEKHYPGKKIFFIHFSTKFDDREELKKRAETIKEIMLNLSNNNKNIINIFLDDNDISRNKDESFPYHYSKKTFEKFVTNWNQYD